MPNLLPHKYHEGNVIKKYNYIGYLFQGRYFSELIESDSQMLETGKDIFELS
jgi:hypothetical protein